MDWVKGAGDHRTYQWLTQPVEWVPLWEAAVPNAFRPVSVEREVDAQHVPSDKGAGAEHRVVKKHNRCRYGAGKKTCTTPMRGTLTSSKDQFVDFNLTSIRIRR